VTGTLTTAHKRLIIPIVDPRRAVDGILRPTGPLRLDAIELVIDVADSQRFGFGRTSSRSRLHRQRRAMAAGSW